MSNPRVLLSEPASDIETAVAAELRAARGRAIAHDLTAFIGEIVDGGARSSARTRDALQATEELGAELGRLYSATQWPLLRQAELTVQSVAEQLTRVCEILRPEIARPCPNSEAVAEAVDRMLSAHEVKLAELEAELGRVNEVVQSCTLAIVVARLGALREHVARLHARLDEIEDAILALNAEAEGAAKNARAVGGRP